jgi:hypothetical protein
MRFGRERRREHRSGVFKSARIVFHAGKTVIYCTVRNLSAGGAMLNLPTVVGVPDRFVLEIDSATKYDCQVRWRSERHLGVKFLKPAR